MITDTPNRITIEIAILFMIYLNICSLPLEKPQKKRILLGFLSHINPIYGFFGAAYGVYAESPLIYAITSDT